MNSLCYSSAEKTENDGVKSYAHRIAWHCTLQPLAATVESSYISNNLTVAIPGLASLGLYRFLKLITFNWCRSLLPNVILRNHPIPTTNLTASDSNHGERFS